MASFKSYFRWILNSVCSLLLAQIALISYAEIPSDVTRMRTEIGDFSVTKNSIMAPWESPFTSNF